MDVDETIRRGIGKAADEARRIVAEEEKTPYVLDHIRQYSALDMDAEWRRFSRRRSGRPARRVWLRWCFAAASVLFAVAAAVLLLSRNMGSESPRYALFDSGSVSPGSRTATLTVGGETFRLEKDSRLEVFPAQIRLTEGGGHAPRVLPTAGGESTTVSVPRGGEYSLLLADGTKVWLNSDSRITFPEQFSARERRVKLEGEACFEVAKNEDKPFYVSVGALQVHVTGTVFNVKARSGKPVEVTLASGAVLMERRDGSLLAALKPGQRFDGAADGGSFSVGEADMDVALAWRNGLFVFKDEPLGSIAEQLSLWYNLDITVPQELSARRYSGELNRYKSIEPLLKILRLTGEMEFIDSGKGRMEIVSKGK